MKLLGGNKSKIAQDKSGENMPNLKITQVVLVHCNIVNNDYKQDSRALYAFIPNKSLVNYQIFLLKYLLFKKTFN